MTPQKENLLLQINRYLEDQLASGITNNPDEILRLENKVMGMLTEATMKGILPEIPEIHVVPNPVDPQGLFILDAEEYKAYLDMYGKPK